MLNFSLAFDNVVWGDEAFSGNTICNTNLYGIFQRPNIKNWSKELFVILMLWLVILLTIIFTYVVSVLLNPLTVD